MRARHLPPSTPALTAEVRLLQATGQVLLVLAVLVLVAGLGLWLLRQPALALRAIHVQGEVLRHDATSLRAQVLPQLQGNFVTMDLARTRAAFEAVPWVRQAVARRVWPMQLVVQIEEHRAVALWGADDGTELLVNSHGEVFEANVGDVEDERLPRLDGPLGSAAMVLAMAQRLQPLLAPLDAGALQALTLSPRGSWRVQLDKGVRLELGRGSDAEVLARAEQFVRTMPRVVATYQRPLESADLRHLGGFAVRLKGITTEVPTADARKRPAG